MTDNTQPEAIRLAGELEKIWADVGWNLNAAAELRRLHEVNQELLEALKVLVANGGIGSEDMFDDAKAAIAKAEEQA